MKARELIQKLLDEVRGNALFTLYKGGNPEPDHRGCEICGSTWKPDEEECHVGPCLITVATAALAELEEETENDHET